MTNLKVLDMLKLHIRDFSLTVSVVYPHMKNTNISGWKNKTNPRFGSQQGKNQMYYVIDIDTDTGKLVAEFKRLDNFYRERILKYVEAYAGIMKKRMVDKCNN